MVAGTSNQHCPPLNFHNPASLLGWRTPCALLAVQVWLALYNLVVDPSCRARMELTESRCESLFRLKKHFTELLLDQVGRAEAGWGAASPQGCPLSARAPWHPQSCPSGIARVAYLRHLLSGCLLMHS